MLLDLTPTPATLSVFYGADASKSASATKNTMWFNKPLRGIGYNIRGTNSGTATISSPVLATGLSGETNNYFEHTFGSGTWSYGIEVVGVDGTTVFAVGATYHPKAPALTKIISDPAQTTGATVTYTPNWEASATKLFYSTGATVDSSSPSISLGTSPATVTGLASNTRYTASIGSVLLGNTNLLTTPYILKTGCVFFDDFTRADSSTLNNQWVSALANGRAGSGAAIVSNQLALTMDGASATSDNYLKLYGPSMTYATGRKITLDMASLCASLTSTLIRVVFGFMDAASGSGAHQLQNAVGLSFHLDTDGTRKASICQITDNVATNYSLMATPLATGLGSGSMGTCSLELLASSQAKAYVGATNRTDTYTVTMASTIVPFLFMSIGSSASSNPRTTTIDNVTVI